MLYRACQFAVDRDVAAEVVIRVLGEPCPEPMCPSAVYSVDLVFRFLPDVRRHLNAMPEDDPVVTAVMRWAAEWPLSSVGMSGVPPANLTIISRHDGLRRKYADRIIAAGDIERANDPAIRAAIEEAIGAHPGLAGSFRP
jgi:hypothetical protein